MSTTTEAKIPVRDWISSVSKNLTTKDPDWTFAPPKWVATVSVFVVAAVHIYVAWGGRGPVVVPDETGNLGNAHTLAGIEPTWTLAGSGYMPGLGILIAPLWWLTDDPMMVFQGGLAIVVALAIALVWPLARIARHFGASSTGAVVVASIVALAPARSIQSNYVMSESLLALTTALVVLCSIRLVRNPSSVTLSVVFGLVGSLPFLAHGRGLAVTIAAGLWLLWRARTNWRVSAIALAALMVGTFVWFLLYEWIVERLYWSDNRVSNSLQGFGGTLTEMMANIGGLAWYAVAAWPAVIAIAVIYLIFRSRSEPVAQLIVILVAGVFGMAVVSLSDPNSTLERIDSYVYGRYIENGLVVLAVIGISTMVRIKSRSLSLLSLVGAVLAVVVFQALTVPIIPVGGVWSDLHAAGVSHYLSRYNYANDIAEPWLLLSFVTLVLTVGVLVLSRFRGVAVWVLGGYFLFLSVANDDFRVDPWDDRVRTTDTIRELVLPLNQKIPIYFDANYGRLVNIYNFALSPQELRVLDLGDLPEDVTYLVSSIEAEDPFASGALPLDQLSPNGLAVWVYPGPELDRLTREGVILVPVVDET